MAKMMKALDSVCEDANGSPRCKWFGRQKRREFDSNLVLTLRFCRCPALMRDNLAVMLTDTDVVECTFFEERWR